ncbi:uncharacterized protein [Mobula birostris]|uniref:uncharacterized protein n=1 Tax=Mobula birostris TaxID=1983395 RepID=UPI003B28DC73
MQVVMSELFSTTRNYWKESTTRNDLWGKQTEPRIHRSKDCDVGTPRTSPPGQEEWTANKLRLYLKTKYHLLWSPITSDCQLPYLADLSIEKNTGQVQGSHKLIGKELPSSDSNTVNLLTEENTQPVVKSQSPVSLSSEGMSWTYLKPLGGMEPESRVMSQSGGEDNISVNPATPEDLISDKSLSPISPETQGQDAPSLGSGSLDGCPPASPDCRKESSLPEQANSSKPIDKEAREPQVEFTNFLTPSAEYLEQIMDNVPTNVQTKTASEKSFQQQEPDSSLLALSATFGMLVDEGLHLLKKTMDNVYSSMQSGNRQMHIDMVHLHNVIHMGWVQLAEQMSSLINVLTTLVQNQQASSTLLRNVALQSTIAISERHFPDYLGCTKITEEPLHQACCLTDENSSSTSKNPVANHPQSESYYNEMP